MGVLILSDMPLEIPLLQLEISMKILGQEATTLKESKFLMVEAPLGWRNFTQEMSPQDTCVDSPSPAGSGDGCPICELHF